MIQMLRFVPLVSRRGARVVLAVQPGLKRLAMSLPGVAEVVTSGDVFGPVDCHCPLFSLPHLLRIRLATLPATFPYLGVPAPLIAAWRERLGPRRGPRVGIVWSGSPANSHDRRRSIPASELAPLLSSPGVEFHLLQNDLRPEDRHLLSALPNLRTHDDGLTDLAEAAALATNMDLVITVCTAMAHLAGALALPAWVLVSASASWVWLTERTDSPWYPTLRVFRQAELGRWRPVVEQVAHALRHDRVGPGS